MTIRLDEMVGDAVVFAPRVAAGSFAGSGENFVFCSPPECELRKDALRRVTVQQGKGRNLRFRTCNV